MSCFNYQSKSAKSTSYINTTSGLASLNVQDAIDEIVAGAGSGTGKGASYIVNTFADLPDATLNATKLGVTLIDQGSWVNRFLGTFYSKGWYYSDGSNWIYKGDWTLNDEADEINYDNATSGLTATEVQSAIDELAASSGGGYGTITSTADWNALLTDGKYLTSGATYVNAPLFDLTTLGVLTVTRTAPTDAYIMQEWTEKTTCNTWKRCSKNSGTNWSMWKTVKDFSEARGIQITVGMEKNVIITNPTADAALIAGLRIDITSGNASIPYALDSDVLRNKIQLGTGTNASSHVYTQQIAYQNALNFINKKGGLRFETLVSLPSDVSTATEDYTVTFGSQSRTIPGMKMLSYNHAENSGNWSAISDNGGTETVTDTGIVPAHGYVSSSAVSSFNVLRTEWLKTTDTVNFFIDDVLVDTHTTNNGNNFRFEIGFKKNAGTTARNMAVGETTYQFCIEAV